MLDAEEIGSIQTFLENTLNETCAIKQRTPTNAGTGPTVAETDRATGVHCRRSSQYRPQERTAGGQVRAQEDIVLTIPAAQAIAVTDRVVFSDATYEVVEPLATSQSFCRRVLCKKV